MKIGSFTKILSRKRKDIEPIVKQQKYNTKESTTLILIAPSYDSLTACMQRWLEEIARQVNGNVQILFNEDANSVELVKCLSSVDTDEIILIFYGHGDSEALLTAPALGTMPNELKLGHSTLLEFKDIPDEKLISIIAYCCSSATILGRNIKNQLKDGKYLGFLDNLPFILGTDEREKAFKGPINIAVGKVITLGSLKPDIIEILKILYQLEFQNWFVNRYNDDRSDLISSLIEEHWNLLDKKVES
jgi:hypothetical protein